MNEEDKKGFAEELNFYLVGFCLCLALTLVPFLATYVGIVSFGMMIGLIGVCGLLQIVIQFRYFLHIDLSDQKREDLQLILFSTLLLIIMAIGTIWVLGNLAERMM